MAFGVFLHEFQSEPDLLKLLIVYIVTILFSFVLSLHSPGHLTKNKHSRVLKTRQ
jgi:hypothetical protein